MMPNTAPMASRRTFSVSSTFASAISSWMRIWIFSRTSSTARPRSETGGGSVDKALQHPREDERAGERRADEHLGALGERRLRGGAANTRLGTGRVGGGRRVRRRRPPDAGRRHARAGDRRHGLGPPALRVGLGLRLLLIGLLARGLRGLQRLLGLLALAPRTARELLALFLRLDDLLLGLRGFLFGAPGLGGL